MRMLEWHSSQPQKQIISKVSRLQNDQYGTCINRSSKPLTCENSDGMQCSAETSSSARCVIRQVSFLLILDFETEKKADINSHFFKRRSPVKFNFRGTSFRAKILAELMGDAPTPFLGFLNGKCTKLPTSSSLNCNDNMPGTSHKLRIAC